MKFYTKPFVVETKRAGRRKQLHVTGPNWDGFDLVSIAKHMPVSEEHSEIAVADLKPEKAAEPRTDARRVRPVIKGADDPEFLTSEPRVERSVPTKQIRARRTPDSEAEVTPAPMVIEIESDSLGNTTPTSSATGPDKPRESRRSKRD